MHPGIVHIRKWRSLSPRAPKTNTCKGFSGRSRMCMISKLYLLVPLLPSGTMDAVALRLLPPLAVSLPTSQPPVYRLLSDIVYYCRTSLHAHAPIASRTQIRSSCAPATAGLPAHAVSQATTNPTHSTAATHPSAGARVCSQSGLTTSMTRPRSACIRHPNAQPPSG